MVRENLVTIMLEMINAHQEGYETRGRQPKGKVLLIMSHSRVSGH
jgi:hypothetical protein